MPPFSFLLIFLFQGSSGIRYWNATGCTTQTLQRVLQIWISKSFPRIFSSIFCVGQRFGLLSSYSDTFPWVGCSYVGTLVQNCNQPFCEEIVRGCWRYIGQLTNNVTHLLSCINCCCVQLGECIINALKLT